MNASPVSPATPKKRSRQHRFGSGVAGSDSPELSACEAFVLLATPTVEEAIRCVDQLDSRSDPEIFHKLRVALRRLRSLWWAYRPLLDEADAEHWREQFKSLASAAGKTRDWDILRNLLVAYESTQRPTISLLEFVDNRRMDALLLSCKAIEDAHVTRLLERAVMSARSQLDSSATKPTLTEFARERVRLADETLNKRMKRAISANKSAYVALHEIRIAGKKLRYLLEFFSPVLDVAYKTTIERLKSAQEELGELNDVVSSEALLREFAPQFGHPEMIVEAIRYLNDQKKHHFDRAYKMLTSMR
ncbi:CHAD domain-containing protein [Paraburkholderia fungorum]|jgi:CHAD domain-containing protein|uniref:CHAD domain-containing protein n=1 Tax=Paraburkholderia fungorum TaxID=134537 RepID=UPI00160A3613|nr:CHAD domain-containing protein [Paraburkholderia fungorum]MBB4518239.1 CHAD domain-containing protein [Paraburkholderia fungorum]